MIYDLFPFYNEVEILKIRLAELYDVVGQFIVVEATVTHKGDPKPCYFADNRSQFDPWLDKIRNIVITDMPMQPSNAREPDHMFDDPAWKREWFQMDRAIEQINIGDTESMIYTDVDEIPLNSAVREFKTSDECVTLLLPEHQFYLNWKLPKSNFNSCMAIGHWLRGKRRAQIRHQHGFVRNRTIPDAGWHFSSMGGPEMVKLKLNSFCHWNRACVLNYTHLPEPKDSPIPRTWEGSDITKLKIDDAFPKYVRDNVDMLIAKGYIHTPLI